jgi:squalene cyclase
LTPLSVATLYLLPQGYNGSQLWDSSFAVQAMLDTASPNDTHSVIAFIPVVLPQGYNGSQLWDTSFAVQAMLDTSKSLTVL